MSKRAAIEEFLQDVNPEALFLDGFDDAIVGTSHRCAQPRLVVYDHELMLRVLVERDGMDADEANEYLDFNVLGAWVGEHTPIVLTRYTPGADGDEEE